MKRIALVGMPNSGKSTLFNRLTGGIARVANWPGLTVESTSGRILLGANMVQIIDLPGIYNLMGGGQDEQLTHSFLATTPLHAIVLVLNATQLDRQLSLALQFKALQVPLFVLLNMADEAKAAGIEINVKGLSQALACPVLSISAKYLLGLAEMKSALAQYVAQTLPCQLDFQNLQLQSSATHYYDKERVLCRLYVRKPAMLAPYATQQLDRWLLHPTVGLPLFILIMLALFQLTYQLGRPIQHAIEIGFTWIQLRLLQPMVIGWPDFLSGFIMEGLFSGILTVLVFTPVIFLFFVLMGIIEDSGYFARAAFMMDGLMSKVGLDGRSFVMLIMGFGCNVPALMGTRAIRDRKAQLLTMLIIPFSLCSARLQIFLFLSTTLFSPAHAPWVLLSLYFVSIIVSLGTALFFRRSFSSCEPFALELPPYRLPVLSGLWQRGWHECRLFLKRTSAMIILGVVLVWLLTHYPSMQDSFSSKIADYMRPVLDPIGIHAELSIALIFGLVAKEVVLGALSVIVGQSGQGLAQHLIHTLDPISAYSFMLFTLVYIPCLSTVSTIKKESKDIKFTILSLGWSLILAWVLSFIFYQIACILRFP